MMIWSFSTFSWHLYAVLLIIRVVVAPFLPGYIHPDEFFQGGQELWFGCPPTIPWEFDPHNALRSVLPPLIMTWIPLRVYAWVFGRSIGSLSGKEVLVIPRIACALLSILFVDRSIWKLSMESNSRIKTNEHRGVPVSVLLVASAWPTMVMLTRPFSNTLETFCLATLLTTILGGVQFDDTATHRPSNYSTVFALKVGTVCAVGFFTRFTFVFFAAPALLFLLYRMIQTFGGIGLRSGLWTRLIWMVVSFGTLSLCIIWRDTNYYTSSSHNDLRAQQKMSNSASSMSSYLFFPTKDIFVILTPLNALLYNSQISNLKDHGLHPRWTHAFVNMFIMYGPLTLVGYSFITRASPTPPTLPSAPLSSATSKGKSLNQRRNVNKKITMYVSGITVLSGLAFLSAAPHQEPRFLLPLIFPLVLLGHSIVGSFIRSFFLMTWLVFNLTLLFFFGILHQAGVGNSLLAIGSSLMDRNPTTWIFWRTYMPPTFLTRATVESSTTACREGNRIVDLNGSASTILWDTLKSELDCTEKMGIPVPEKKPRESVHLAVPYLLNAEMETSSSYSFAGEDHCKLSVDSYNCSFVASFGPHLSTEDFPPFDGAILSFYKRLAFNVYEITCIN
jgi:phosphatidylinositol glycan class Z